MSNSSALLRYGGESIPYELVPSPRRKTLGIEVHPDLRVVVRVPSGYSEDDVRARLQRRAQWINRQRSRFQRFMPRTPPRAYVAGESHLYLGRSYRLKLQSDSKESVSIKDDFLVVASPRRLSPGRVQALLVEWYRGKARAFFSKVLEKSISKTGTHVAQTPSISVRRMEGRWGSLSERGCMTLNLDLIKAPRACIEYVVIHELCHIEHKSHSDAFFKALGRVMPDWEKKKKRLEAVLL